MLNYAYLVKVSIIQGDGQNLFRKTVLREIRYHAERKGVSVTYEHGAWSPKLVLQAAHTLP